MSIVAVAGGNGFIGSTFIDMYKKEFSEVRIITREFEKENMEDYDNVKYCITDYEFESLSEKLIGVDYLIVLAGQREASTDYLTYLPSIKLYINLLEASLTAKIKKIVFASSISVFGNSNPLPWTEDMYPKAETMYGIHKLTLEQIGNWYHLKHDLPVISVRFAHIYGANERNNYMINLFMRKAYNHEPLELHTPAIAKRDFLYVKDAAKSLLCAIKSDVREGFYNITCGEALDNWEVAETINKVFGNPHEVHIKEPDAVETIVSSYMLGDLARQKLNFEATYTMETAMKEIKSEMEGLGDVPIFY